MLPLLIKNRGYKMKLETIARSLTKEFFPCEHTRGGSVIEASDYTIKICSKNDDAVKAFVKPSQVQEDGQVKHVIFINSDLFARHEAYQNLQCLVHQLVHIYQLKTKTASRDINYHNAGFCGVMLTCGIVATKPEGSAPGTARIVERVIKAEDGGKFDKYASARKNLKFDIISNKIGDGVDKLSTAARAKRKPVSKPLFAKNYIYIGDSNCRACRTVAKRNVPAPMICGVCMQEYTLKSEPDLNKDYA